MAFRTATAVKRTTVPIAGHRSFHFRRFTNSGISRAAETADRALKPLTDSGRGKNSTCHPDQSEGSAENSVCHTEQSEGSALALLVKETLVGIAAGTVDAEVHVGGFRAVSAVSAASHSNRREMAPRRRSMHTSSSRPRKDLSVAESTLARRKSAMRRCDCSGLHYSSPGLSARRES